MPRGQYNHQPQSDLDPRICQVCGSSFQPYRDSARTCSKKCYRKLPDVRGKSAVYRALPIVRARKNAARNQRYTEEPERRVRNMASGLLRKYGLTLEQYQAKLAAQGGRCAICGETPVPNGIKSAARLHVDHDHATDRNRGLLCNRCNQGIGYFKDDPDLFQAAADYIRRHREEVAATD